MGEIGWMRMLQGGGGQCAVAVFAAAATVAGSRQSRESRLRSRVQMCRFLFCAVVVNMLCSNTCLCRVSIQML